MEKEEENVDRVIRKGIFNKEDLKALVSQIAEQDSLRRLKRRWLMDLDLSKREQKRLIELLPPNDKILPESLLREDDVSYEDLRTCIEMGFGVRKCALQRHCSQEGIQIANSCGDFKDVFSHLDHLTNIGLYSVAKILTGEMIMFEKTNWSMKKAIRKLLPRVICSKDDISAAKLKLIIQLLKDPQNFHGNIVMASIPSETYYSAAVRVLDGLEDFSFIALDAMRRKLLGITRSALILQSPKRSGRGRDNLISLIRKRCSKMLLKLGKMDEPPEPLAAALGIAGLTLKLLRNHPPEIDFRKFSPEIEALQNDIAKAIWLVDDAKRVDLTELRHVQLLLGLNSELSVRSLRNGVRHLLTEYLFECADMEKVPDCLIESLDLISRKSQFPRYRKRSTSEMRSSPRELREEEIQNEVECVLNVSAQAKQIVLHWFPEREFDLEFADAYAEDFAESDSLCVSDDDDGDGQSWIVPPQSELHSHYSCGQAESVGETSPMELNSPVSTSESDGCSSRWSPNNRLNIPPESMHFANGETCSFVHSLENKIGLNMDKDGCTREQGLSVSNTLKETIKQDLSSLSQIPVRNPSRNSQRNLETTSYSVTTQKVEFSEFTGRPEDHVSQQLKSGNLYLEIQEACDDTSMVAYRVIGQMLHKLAMVEGMELYQGDRSYLHSCAAIPEDTEEYPHSTLVSKLSGIWNSVLGR